LTSAFLAVLALFDNVLFAFFRNVLY